MTRSELYQLDDNMVAITFSHVTSIIVSCYRRSAMMPSLPSPITYPISLT